MRRFSKAFVARLDGDTALLDLLAGGESQYEEEIPVDRSDRPNGPVHRIWESSVEVHNMFNQQGDRWITFEVVQDDRADVEQTEDLRELAVHVHVWCREPDSDPAEQIDDRLRAVLNRAHLVGDDLLSWYLLRDDFYVKERDPELRTWHIVTRYSGMFMDWPQP